jgi:hypothetical protein
MPDDEVKQEALGRHGEDLDRHLAGLYDLR